MKGISIIIPTYNRAELVKDAIRSVINQDFPGPMEIIISDDGSKDETLAVASSFEPKVKVLRKPNSCKSQGAAGARNRGIIKASQPYICFLDSDDFYLPGHLMKMVTALESRPGYGFALCNSLKMLDIARENRFKRWTKPNIDWRDLRNLAISTTLFAHTISFIFKKEVFERVGLFDERYKNAEDTDTWMRINENFKGIHADHYGTVIRLHTLQRLTDVPKQFLLQIHYDVFRSAIRRYKDKNLNNKYRLCKLWLLCLKYKISQWPGLRKIYKIISKRNTEESILTADSSTWKSLEYFINSQ